MVPLFLPSPLFPSPLPLSSAPYSSLHFLLFLPLPNTHLHACKQTNTHTLAHSLIYTHYFTRATHHNWTVGLQNAFSHRISNDGLHPRDECREQANFSHPSCGLYGIKTGRSDRVFTCPQLQETKHKNETVRASAQERVVTTECSASQVIARYVVGTSTRADQLADDLDKIGTALSEYWHLQRVCPLRKPWVYSSGLKCVCVCERERERERELKQNRWVRIVCVYLERG